MKTDNTASSSSGTVSILVATLFLLLICTACSPSTGYRLVIENHAEEPVKALTLNVADETILLGNLQPGESRVKQLEIKHEGSITYRFKTGEDLCFTGILAKHIAPGETGDWRIVISGGGRGVVVDNMRNGKVEPPPGKPARGEWALPCMIPG